MNQNIFVKIKFHFSPQAAFGKVAWKMQNIRRTLLDQTKLPSNQNQPVPWSLLRCLCQARQWCVCRMGALSAHSWQLFLFCLQLPRFEKEWIEIWGEMKTPVHQFCLLHTSTSEVQRWVDKERWHSASHCSQKRHFPQATLGRYPNQFPTDKKNYCHAMTSVGFASSCEIGQCIIPMQWVCRCTIVPHSLPVFWL